MSSSSESAPLIAGGRGGSGPFRNPAAISPVIVVAAPPTDGRPDGRPDDQTALATAPPVNGDAELGESDSSLSGSHGGRRKGAWVGALGALVGGAVVAVIIVATVLEANLLDFGYTSGAVATDAQQCSDLGVSILRQGGSAVDAAVTTTLCIGLVNSHSSGIGGGGFMVIWNGTDAETIDFRETAPAAATTEMFTEFDSCFPDNNGTGGGGQDDTSLCPSLLGGLAVGVPGEIYGLELAHRKYGRLPWASVVTPVADLCRDGVAVTGANAGAIRANERLLRQHPLLNSTFLPDGVPLVEGDIMRRPLLADTLYRIAAEGSAAFYSGDIAAGIIEEVLSRTPWTPGVMAAEDLANYSAAWREPVGGTYQGHQLWSMPPPASGAVLIMILNLLEGYGYTCGDTRDAASDHRIIEAFKFGYAYRGLLSDPCCGDAGSGECSNATHCATTTATRDEMVGKALAERLRPKIWDNQTHADPAYYGGQYDVENTPGTTHISVVGKDNDAVAITSTINTHFGAKLMTKHGIILNNQMDDFSSPGITNAYGFEPSPDNFIWPWKRPLSSTSPTIVVGADGRFEMAVGASGGSKITTGVAQVVLNVLSFCRSVRDAVDEPRIHHQLLPDMVQGESDYPGSIRDRLEALGHNWTTTSSVGVCQAVISGRVGPDDLVDDHFYAASDRKRKPGAGAAGYD